MNGWVTTQPTKLLKKLGRNLIHSGIVILITASWRFEVFLVTINNAYVFFGVAGALFAYILYTMIRARKGLRPESRESEIDL